MRIRGKTLDVDPEDFLCGVVQFHIVCPLDAPGTLGVFPTEPARRAGW